MGKDIWTVIIIPRNRQYEATAVSFNRFEDAVDYAAEEIMNDQSNYDGSRELSEHEVKEILDDQRFFQEDSESTSYSIEESKLF